MSVALAPACIHCSCTLIQGDLFCTHCGWCVSWLTSSLVRPLEAPPGSLQGSYRVLRIGGRGATGRVLLALEERSHRLVAVKEILGDRETQARFLREASITRNLSHRNIVPQMGSWIGSDGMYTVMPWIEGSSLRELLDQEGPFELLEVLWIVEQIARALKSAHQINIVHRDVKPANILVDMDGVPVLCDFGIAKSLEAPDVTMTGVGPGSPAYMAPEQIRGAAEPASDQYALGIMAFELIAGFRPYTGAAIDVQMAHLGAPPPPFHQVTDRAGRHLPREVADALARLVRKPPHERWPSIDAFADAIIGVADFHGYEARTRLGQRVARGRLRRTMWERLEGEGERESTSANSDMPQAVANPLPEGVAKEEPREMPRVEAAPESPESLTFEDIEDSAAAIPTSRPRRLVPILAVAIAAATVPAIVWLGPSFMRESAVPAVNAVDPRMTDTSSLLRLADSSRSGSQPKDTRSDAAAPSALPAAPPADGPAANRQTPRSRNPTEEQSRDPAASIASSANHPPSVPDTEATVPSRTVEVDSSRTSEVLQASAPTALSNAPSADVAPSRAMDIPAAGQALSQVLALRDEGLRARLAGSGAVVLWESLRNGRWPTPVTIIDSIAGEVVHAHATYAMRNAIGRRETWIAHLRGRIHDLQGRWTVDTWRRSEP